MEIDSFSYGPNRQKIFGIKSGIILGNRGNSSFPLAYISKPKHISESDFRIILDGLDIKLRLPKPELSEAGE